MPSAPETFDMISTTVDVAARKNLAQISQVLTQIASGSEFGDDLPRYLPINEMVRRSIAQITAWMLQRKLLHAENLCKLTNFGS